MPKDWKGGSLPTGLSSGNDSFSDVQSHKATFKGIDERHCEVGREETVNVVGSADNGGGKKK